MVTSVLSQKVSIQLPLKKAVNSKFKDEDSDLAHLSEVRAIMKKKSTIMLPLKNMNMKNHYGAKARFGKFHVKPLNFRTQDQFWTQF